MVGLKQHGARGFLATAWMLLCACSVDSRPPCPQVSATFRLQLSASDGPLPEDTVLTVHFGGSEQETYSLSDDNADNEVLCCRRDALTAAPIGPVPCGHRATADAASSDASFGPPRGRHGSPPPALHCELWTNGAAEVEVSARGYAALDETLEARLAEPEAQEEREMLKGCTALETVDVSLELQLQEAGVY